MRIEPSLPFFTTSMVQIALRALIEMEEDEAIAAYKAGLAAHGRDAFIAFWQEIADSLTK